MTVDPNAQFNADFDKLKDAAAAYEKAQEELKAAEQAYKDTVLKKLDSLKSAEAILAYLISGVFENSEPPTSKTADATIFGIFGDKLGLKGKALQVNSYLTAVHNDLQKLTNSDSSDPIIVKDVADDLDSILHELKTNTSLQDAMGPDALSNMESTDQTLRNQFWIAGDDANNPTGDDYYFTYGDGKPPKITNFKEMQDLMKEPGDKLSATEAYKHLSDNFNADTSMTQTMNSAVNEEINQLTSFIKTIQGFYMNGLCQPQMKLSNAAIQNQARG